jgi:pyruvate/2-oxoglutarate dehydrogenase complex dihydrolipoamide acyltransferase (E2) component
MDICSPKDGFVVALLVDNEALVHPGHHLLTMDTDDEDRDKARLVKMESVRLQMAQQYSGPELDLSRSLTQISVDLAQEAVTDYGDLLKHVQGNADLGKATLDELVPVTLQYNQAVINLKKAQLELKKFEFAVARHVEINSIIDKYMAQESSTLDIKRGRLTVLAPISGKVKLQTAVNSFSELGGVLLTIEP